MHVLCAVFILSAIVPINNETYAAESSSGTLLGEFTSKVSSSLVSFSYTYSVNSKVKIQGSGYAMLQGNAFYMKGNGLEIWCNGRTKWTVDRTAGEAVVESADANADDYDANPARMIGSVSKVFDVVSDSKGTFNGKKVDMFVLSPRVKMSIRRLKLYFSGKDLVGASVAANDGNVTDFVIFNMIFKSKGSTARFDFDEKKLDKSYIVTDLR